MASHQNAIAVNIRVRPLVAHERGQQPCLMTRDNEVHIIPNALPNEHAGEGPWGFDCAMDSSDPSSPDFVSNAKCYELVGHHIIDHAFEGYNSCLFCYGQTGTGKTTTIIGDQKSGPGVLICLFQELFQRVREEERSGCEFKVHVQMLEVYNEKIFDLLASSQERAPIRGSFSSEHDTHKPAVELHVLPAGVQVRGAELKEVTSVEECLELIDYGNTKKHMAATAMNPQSSRGHTVFKLCIEKTDKDHGIHMGSELYFADLAGHESEKTTQVTGERLVELSFINKSLMWLQSAIHSLAKAGLHKGVETPSRAALKRSMSTGVSMSDFRNSKLTLLMSNALTGNSLVNVIVTLSPAEAHFPTSLSSLKFANEVKRIKVTAHSSVAEDKGATIVLLQHEVQSLKEQLASALSGGTSVPREPSNGGTPLSLSGLRRCESSPIGTSGMSQTARESFMAKQACALAARTLKAARRMELKIQELEESVLKEGQRANEAEALLRIERDVHERTGDVEPTSHRASRPTAKVVGGTSSPLRKSLAQSTAAGNIYVPSPKRTSLGARGSARGT